MRKYIWPMNELLFQTHVSAPHYCLCIIVKNRLGTRVAVVGALGPALSSDSLYTYPSANSMVQSPPTSVISMTIEQDLESGQATPLISFFFVKIMLAVLVCLPK